MSLMAVDPDYGLQQNDLEMIRDWIQGTLGGRFEFVFWREADTSDSEED
jgi:hypothetical protein